MRLTYLDLSVSALKKCNANPHHRTTIEEKHCVAQQPPMKLKYLDLSAAALRRRDTKEKPSAVFFSDLTIVQPCRLL
jgi:hypothetical protein